MANCRNLGSWKIKQFSLSDFNPLVLSHSLEIIYSRKLFIKNTEIWKYLFTYLHIVFTLYVTFFIRDVHHFCISKKLKTTTEKRFLKYVVWYLIQIVNPVQLHQNPTFFHVDSFKSMLSIWPDCLTVDTGCHLRSSHLWYLASSLSFRMV